MVYDFYIQKVADLENDCAKIIEKGEQLNDRRNSAQKKRLKQEYDSFKNGFWQKICNEIHDSHWQFKTFHALSCGREESKGILKEQYNNSITNSPTNMPSFAPSIKSLDGYPPYTLFLQFKFTLAKPYLSKDDEAFYVSENPIRKDKVFKAPMVSSSTWKGTLRWTARMVPGGNHLDIIKRLFGNERGAANDFHQGRLRFYDTFFHEIGLEVINPHDRKTKAGTLPITIESVPAGEKGDFNLLYMPIDLMGHVDDKYVRSEVAMDLNLLANALYAMMLDYGFSAKKRSGYGVIEPSLEDVQVEMPGVTPIPKNIDKMTKLRNTLHRVAAQLQPEGRNDNVE